MFVGSNGFELGCLPGGAEGDVGGVVVGGGGAGAGGFCAKASGARNTIASASSTTGCAKRRLREFTSVYLAGGRSDSEV